jgi:histone deacetylase 6
MSQKNLRAGNDEYIYVFERILAPIISYFKPEFTIISSGFDSAKDDYLGGLHLEIDGYAYMTKRLMQLTQKGRVVGILEGGYNMESISWACEGVIRALSGENLPITNS